MPRYSFSVRRPLIAGLVALVLTGAIALPAATADDLPPGGYPSWQDVERAKQDEATKVSEITTITGLLDGLRAQSEELGDAAVSAAAEYAVTQGALGAATAKLDVSAAQAARANAELTRYRKEIGALAAESYKTGGTNMGFFVALDAVGSDTVHGLNIARMVGNKTAGLVTKAAAAERVASAQAGQESLARAERERLAAESASKLEAARDAREAMALQLNEQQRRGDELTAQLASLKGTTATLEAEAREGEAALAAYRVAQAAKRVAAEELARQQAEVAAEAAAEARKRETARQEPPPAAEPPPPAAVGPAEPQRPQAPAAIVPPPPAPVPAAPAVPAAPRPVVPVVPGGAANDPAGAQAYASSRLGGFGWGQDQFPCLRQLWNKESNWMTTATNPYSGAYGIAQSLPASKYSSAGSDWLSNYRTQIEWGLSYIQNRYGSPCAAWDHSVAVNWY